MALVRNILALLALTIAFEIALKSGDYGAGHLPSGYIRWGIGGMKTAAHALGSGLRELAAPTILEYACIIKELGILPGSLSFEFVYGLFPDEIMVAKAAGALILIGIIVRIIQNRMLSVPLDAKQAMPR